MLCRKRQGTSRENRFSKQWKLSNYYKRGKTKMIRNKAVLVYKMQKSTILLLFLDFSLPSNFIIIVFIQCTLLNAKTLGNVQIEVSTKVMKKNRETPKREPKKTVTVTLEQWHSLPNLYNVFLRFFLTVICFEYVKRYWKVFRRRRLWTEGADVADMTIPYDALLIGLPQAHCKTASILWGRTLPGWKVTKSFGE